MKKEEMRKFVIWLLLKYTYMSRIEKLSNCFEKTSSGPLAVEFWSNIDLTFMTEVLLMKDLIW